MNRLEQALREALFRNWDEIRRWTKYKDSYQEAIDNIKYFDQRLTVEVMVPVGSKAYMPGQLYHTNEILVSHYSGLFSKCSSHQAQDIAKNRMEMAKKHLESLEKERDIYQNKLDLPYSDGAIAGGEEHEIIEEYDEEVEKAWRTEHRRKIRNEKLKVLNDTTKVNEAGSHDDIMKLLDDLEIMEELEEELEKLKVDNDEILKKIISEEILIPKDKQRIPYCTDKNVLPGGRQPEKSITKQSSIVNQISNKYKLINENTLEHTQKLDYTNNNVIPNVDDYDSDTTGSDTLSTDDIPDRILQIEAEAKHLSIRDKIRFFKKNIKEVEKELKESQLNSVDDIDAKISRVEVREYLMDYIEILKDQLIDEPESYEKINVKNSDKKIKRISFSQQDEIQFMDKNEAANTVTRSRIELFDLKLRQSRVEPIVDIDVNSEFVDKKEMIINKVEKCIEFISENQSQQDFDLVGKILNSFKSKNNTLSIKFNHSDKYFTSPGYETNKLKCESEIIGSPADIYRIFNLNFPSKSEPISSKDNYDHGDENGINDNSYKIMLRPIAQKENNPDDISRKPAKPILKKKDYFLSEGIIKDEVKHQPNKLKTHETVMGDVIEHKNDPDPLPGEKFVDTHMPKKRVSRFKQMRSNS